MTETWKFIVVVAFIDFQKAFDSVSHKILIHKLEHNFGICGDVLHWLTDYLIERKQCTLVNGVMSDSTKVICGIPQSSVLGPTLFTLYTSDLPTTITLGHTHLYADDTTIYCVGSSVDEVTVTLNRALIELVQWYKSNSLVPHPTKCEAIIIATCFGTLILIKYRIRPTRS